MSRARRIVWDSSEDELPDLKDITPLRTKRGNNINTSAIQSPTTNADHSAAVPPRSTIRRIKFGSKLTDNPLLRPLASTYTPRSPSKHNVARLEERPRASRTPQRTELQTRDAKKQRPCRDLADSSENESVQEQTITEDFSEDDGLSDFIVHSDTDLDEDSFDVGGSVPRSPPQPRGKQAGESKWQSTSQRNQTQGSPSPTSQLLAEALDAEERDELPWPAYRTNGTFKSSLLPRTKAGTHRSQSVDFADPMPKFQMPSRGESKYKSTFASRYESSAESSHRTSSPPLLSKPQGLPSSSQRIGRIPATAYKPHMNTFWDKEFIDEWNDEYSPTKQLFPSSATKDTGKRPRSPTKRAEPNKAAVLKAAKKAFSDSKHDIAVEFLQELDECITAGKISEMAAETGGIRIEWSTKLNTTAGRANWRRETIRQKGSISMPLSTRYKHHASIELSTKVIDDSDRLLNVIAHEFCHLANFMISDMTTNPHGKEFKGWAAKVTREFGQRGIEVTTKHSYDIDFKYVWECTKCGLEFKRHSKSISIDRHRCGECKAELAQIKPVPRAKPTKESEYQLFLRKHMKIVKEENPDMPQRDIMKTVASRWSQRGSTKSKMSEEEDFILSTASRVAVRGDKVVGVTDDLDDLSIIDLT
ncbi:SprT-like family-domain-containing protein [Coniella lustricola]|uniref:SprT-like family-domain-containing protein n=1 Tax=Coniella lustricola TaxID=2025994 RepID=A0A2T3AHH7_9PEZI|nr:SprT-like family-domain-containing protein [Coniella lustricola]